MKRVCAALALIALFVTGCGKQEAGPKTIVGTWSGWTSSQLGPCYLWHEFGEDGSYSAGGRILAMPFIKKENPVGSYSIQSGRIVTVCGSATNIMRFVLEGDRLRLREEGFKEYILNRKS